jgi:hypothetical protein
MRRFFLYFVLGFILILSSFFLAQNLSPFQMEKIEELIIQNDIVNEDFERLDSIVYELVRRGLILSYLSENTYIVLFCFLLGIFFVFISIHLFLDKLIFKKFYEEPSNFNAIRRAILLILSIVLFLFSKLNLSPSYVPILIVIAPFVIEAAYYLYFKKIDVDDKKEDTDEQELVDNSKLKRNQRHISFDDAFDDIERFGKSKKED